MAAARAKVLQQQGRSATTGFGHKQFRQIGNGFSGRNSEGLPPRQRGL